MPVGISAREAPIFSEKHLINHHIKSLSRTSRLISDKHDPMSSLFSESMHRERQLSTQPAVSQ